MNIMFGKIFFYIISIALFVIMFIKLMRKNDTIYLSSLILQAIGILINFIGLTFKIELNLFFIVITYLISVILSLLILMRKDVGKSLAPVRGGQRRQSGRRA